MTLYLQYECTYCFVLQKLLSSNNEMEVWPPSPVHNFELPPRVDDRNRTSPHRNATMSKAVFIGHRIGCHANKGQWIQAIEAY